MPAKLQTELAKKRPFDSLEQEVYLNLQRTADALARDFAQLLKPAGLSPTQYNALRILRGAGEEGLTCGEIAQRMITRDPDITRLLDRMEFRGWIERTRQAADRRVVKTCITPEGLAILKPLDAPILRLHARQLGHMGPEKLRILSALLELARESKR
jgi:DNA-binding MarR family transcriptional regulator